MLRPVALAARSSGGGETGGVGWFCPHEELSLDGGREVVFRAARMEVGILPEAFEEVRCS